MERRTTLIRPRHMAGFCISRALNDDSELSSFPTLEFSLIDDCSLETTNKNP